MVTQLHIAYKIGYIDGTVLEKLEDRLDKIRATLQSLINKKGGNNKLNQLKWLLMGIFFPL